MSTNSKGEHYDAVRGKDSAGNSGVWHNYAHGKRIFVRDQAIATNDYGGGPATAPIAAAPAPVQPAPSPAPAPQQQAQADSIIGTPVSTTPTVSSSVAQPNSGFTVREGHDHAGHKGDWHDYDDGRKIFVRDKPQSFIATNDYNHDGPHAPVASAAPAAAPTPAAQADNIIGTPTTPEKPLRDIGNNPIGKIMSPKSVESDNIIGPLSGSAPAAQYLDSNPNGVSPLAPVHPGSTITPTAAQPDSIIGSPSAATPASAGAIVNDDSNPIIGTPGEPERPLRDISNNPIGKETSPASADPNSIIGTPSSSNDVSGGNQVTVVQGDTLSGIAASHGISLAQIESLNPQIKDFNLIYPGQQVNLGGGAVAPVDDGMPKTSSYNFTEQPAGAGTGGTPAPASAAWANGTGEVPPDPANGIISVSGNHDTNPLSNPKSNQ